MTRNPGKGEVAFVPVLHGCGREGDALLEFMDWVEEAVELYLEALSG